MRVSVCVSERVRVEERESERERERGGERARSSCCYCICAASHGSDRQGMQQTSALSAEAASSTQRGEEPGGPGWQRRAPAPGRS